MNKLFILSNLYFLAIKIIDNIHLIFIFIIYSTKMFSFLEHNPD